MVQHSRAANGVINSLLVGPGDTAAPHTGALRCVPRCLLRWSLHVQGMGCLTKSVCVHLCVLMNVLATGLLQVWHVGDACRHGFGGDEARAGPMAWMRGHMIVCAEVEGDVS